jgi:hypothetical protein
MSRGYMIVEGHGEVGAAANLVTRLWRDLGLDPQFHWSGMPIRGKAIHTREGVTRACSLVRTKHDAAAMLLVRDADDDIDCPKIRGPGTADWVRAERLAFPCAIVLFRREFETLFLPCLERIAGQPLRDDRGIERVGLLPGTSFKGNYEGIRGGKEWLWSHFPPGRSYKPTLDQLSMTRMIHFDDLRRSGLSSFATLQNGLQFIEQNRGTPGVYPPSSPVQKVESPADPGQRRRRVIRPDERKKLGL